MRKSVTLSIMLLILLSACSQKNKNPNSTDIVTAAIPSSTSTAVPSETPTPNPGKIVSATGLRFDFKGLPQELTSDWERLYIDYANGILRPGGEIGEIRDDKLYIENQGAYSGMNVFYVGERRSSDILLNLDSIALDHPADTILFCRYSTAGWYQFTVSEEKSILWRVTFQGADWFTDEIMTGTGFSTGMESHHFSLSCDTSHLVLSVDGMDLLSAEDDVLPEGSFGFGVGTQAIPGNKKTFDNVVITYLSFPPTPTITATATLTATPRPTLLPTASPTLRPTHIPTTELLLYESDFEENDESLANWHSFAYSSLTEILSDTGFKAASDGRNFKFTALETNQRIFSIYDVDLGTDDVDITLTADVPRSDNHFMIGSICRYSEAGWYQFMVEPLSVWSIRLARLDENGQTKFYTLSEGKYYFDRHGINQLRVECMGDRLSFYANGSLLVSLHDQTFSSGKIGMTAWSLDQTARVVNVEKLIIQRAEWQDTAADVPAPTPVSAEIVYQSEFQQPKSELKDWFLMLAYPFAHYVHQFDSLTDFTAVSVQRDNIMYWEGTQEQYFINDVAPKTGDYEIQTIMANNYLESGLVCRYTQDGWYEVRRIPFPNSFTMHLIRMERGHDGILRYTYLGAAEIPYPQVNAKLSLKCATNQISVALNDRVIIYAEDERWSTGKFGFVGRGTFSLVPQSLFSKFTVLDSKPLAPGETISNESFEDPISSVWNWHSNWGDYFRNEIKEGALQVNLIREGNVRLTFSGAGGGRMSSEGFIAGIFSDSGVQARDIELNVDIEIPSNISGENLTFTCHSIYSMGQKLTIRPDTQTWFMTNTQQELNAGNMPEFLPGVNHISLQCIGREMIFSLNGVEVARGEDPSYDSYLGGNLEINIWSPQTDKDMPYKIDAIEIKIPENAKSFATIDPVTDWKPVYQSIPGEEIYHTDFSFKEFGRLTGGNSGSFPESRWSTLIGMVTYPGDFPLMPPGIRLRGEAYTVFDQDLGNLPVKISADAIFTDSNKAVGSMSLICRKNTLGMYVFSIDADGHWAISKKFLPYDNRALETYVLLEGEVEELRPGINKLTAICDKENLEFQINGKVLGSIQDTTFIEGKAGVGAGINSDIQFQNFSIVRLK